MKRIMSVALVLLIAFSLPLVHRTSTAQIVPLSAQPVHNINTGLNYTTIQAAIDAPETINGHTLSCDAGNYTEKVHVYKSLKIIGAGPTLSWRIPFEPNDTDYITANNVTIEGFTIQSVSGYSAVRLDKVGNCSISNNTITGTGGGITLIGSSDNTVANNVILSLTGNGILLTDFSQRNTIVENSLNLNHYGIVLWNASNYNVISDNFVNSSTWEGIRLNWQGSNFATVAFNNITNNIICHNYDGIFLDSPSNNNLVSDNMASDNNYIGIRLSQANSSTVVHNTVISNSYRGISAESSYANTIDDNFLNNTSNAWDNGANSWIIAKQTGPNIIGGPYMGGNYWSDNPNPVDLNNDGIGDVPYSVPGGSNKDGLPLVTQLPIFIASFMTPEGEPYPFDDIIISNGTWIRKITNETHTVAQMPVNVTFALAYTFGTHHEMYEFSLQLSPGDVRAFEFYAINPYMVLGRVRPYVIGKEAGTAFNLTWQYFDSNNTLIYTVDIEQSGRYVFVDTWIQTVNDFSAGLSYVSSWAERDGKLTADDECPNGWDYDSQNGWLRTYTLPEIVVRGSVVTISYGFLLISENSTPVGVRRALYNHARIDGYALRLYTSNGTSYDPQYFYPQWAVVPGSYILELYNLSNDYAQLKYPLFVSAGAMILDVYPPKIEDLRPYTFSTAGENFFAESTYYNLTNDIVRKSLSVNVSSKTDYDWWGCFVLPKDQMVRTLTAYSGNASYRLRKLYNYTEQTVGNYTIVAVRIPPEIDHLALNYTILGDVDGNGRVDMGDISSLCDGFGATIGLDGNYWHHPACILCPHSPNLDIDCNGRIDMGDIVTGLDHFGQHYP